METHKFGLFQNISITTRLGFAAALATICIGVTAYAGYSGLLQSNEGLTQSITATSALLASSDGDMMHDALRGDVLNAMVYGPEAPEDVRKTILQDLTDHADRFNANLSKLGALELAPEVKAQLETTGPLVAQYIVSARDTVKLALSDPTAADAALPKFLEVFAALEEQMEVQGKLIETLGNGASDSAKQRNGQLLNVLVISAGVAVAVLLVSGLLLARSITKPLTRPATPSGTWSPPTSGRGACPSACRRAEGSGRRDWQLHDHPERAAGSGAAHGGRHQAHPGRDGKRGQRAQRGAQQSVGGQPQPGDRGPLPAGL